MRHPSEEMQQHLRQLGIICLAILSGVVIFAGVVWYLINRGGFSPPLRSPSYLSLLFDLVALVAIAKAQLLHRVRTPPHPGAPEASQIAWHKTNTIIAFALREGAAFTALAGVLVTGRQVGGFAMAGLAVAAMLFSWPRADQIPESRGS